MMPAVHGKKTETPRGKGGADTSKPRHDGRQRGPRPVPVPARPPVDTGPARAGGAFDKLADLLKG